MRRRDFIVALTSAVAAPAALCAQPLPRMRRVGVLIGTTENDPETKNRVKALNSALSEAGWIEGRNIHLDFRYTAGNPDNMRRFAKELLDLAPDAVVVHSNDLLHAWRQTNRTIPTVFVQVGDPIGSGFIESLAHPGGSLTGFTTFESEIGGKWLQTLKEIAPSLTRSLVLFDANIAANVAFLRAAEAASATAGVTVNAAPISNASEFEHVIATFAEGPNAGLIVLPNPTAAVNRAQIIALAARYRLPAIYAFRFFAASGGLVSYGVDTADLYKRTGSYISRILNGEKPADLPVQAPTKYELIINLKTADALGLTIPPSLRAIADELIQ